MSDDDNDKMLVRLNAEMARTLIEKAGESGQQFERAFLNGTLSAIAAHLTRTRGPQISYEIFQKLADECAAPIVEHRA